MMYFNHTIVVGYRREYNILDQEGAQCIHALICAPCHH